MQKYNNIENYINFFPCLIAILSTDITGDNFTGDNNNF